jgi:hypothetical protein
VPQPFTAGFPGARARAWCAFTLALAVNLYVLFNPGGGDTASFVPHRDKIVHMVVFAAVAWTGRRAGIGVRVLGVALAAHAVESELVQHLFLSGRTGDPWDVAADLAGVAAGLLLPIRRHARAGRGGCGIMGE